MKGIILAGGLGTRLYPLTKVLSKQLLPIYDKPMIYYPLSVLMYSGIREILIITTPQHFNLYKSLLGDGKQLGIKFKYKVQNEPKGLADAFILGEEFIGNDSVCMMLGDNLLYGDGLLEILTKSKKDVENNKTSVIYGYYVNKPEDYGVINFDSENNIISIEEKPKNPKSNYAAIGLYMYPNDVVKKVKLVKPSERGEIEITTLNNIYLNEKRLKVIPLGRGYAWFDTGTNESLVEASNLIMSIEQRSGLKVGCIEEIALQNNFISPEDFLFLINKLKDCTYKSYLKKILKTYN
jgi:glucose-1-phosphate thymidylyltransferase